MTCIVGLVHDGAVLIGADSAGVNSDSLRIHARTDRKVFKTGKFVMGFAGSYRMGQLLAYSLSPPRIGEDEDVMKFMVTSFIASVRQCLKDGGHASRANDEEQTGGLFLVGFKGRLFRIDHDYQVGELIDGYVAIGCGEAYALGALYAADADLAPEARVQKALEAATHFSAGVRPPFHIETLSPLHGGKEG